MLLLAFDIHATYPLSPQSRERLFHDALAANATWFVGCEMRHRAIRHLLSLVNSDLYLAQRGGSWLYPPCKSNAHARHTTRVYRLVNAQRGYVMACLLYTSPSPRD